MHDIGSDEKVILNEDLMVEELFEINRLWTVYFNEKKGM